MIDIDLVRSDLDAVAANLARRGVARATIERVATVDAQWREITKKAEDMRAEQNTANEHIATAQGAAREQAIDEMRAVATRLKEAEQELKRVDEKRQQAWRSLPNLVAADVPDGGADDFEIVREVGEIIDKGFMLKSYFELGEGTLFNLEEASRVSGSGFAYIMGELARLQMGLVSWVFDTINEKIAKDPDREFVPVIPPVLVGRRAMADMGYLDHHDDEVYGLPEDNLYLVGTSEQSLGPANLGAMQVRKKIPATKLPQRFVGYSSCFRREAGSHGKDVRGLLRLHQFDKVEMFSFETPDKSQEEHEFLLERQERIMRALELPYRVVKLAAKDLGAPSTKTYDIETWMPSEKRYVETHSTSNTTDYQARRLNVRVAGPDGARHLHMLNGTALAMSRIFIALLENHQQADDSIAIPKALHGHVPFEHIKVKK